jgi:hypothetical protein
MPIAQDLMERARMFEERAERARDPISRQHFRQMAAHYRALSVEHSGNKAGTRTGALRETALNSRGN